MRDFYKIYELTETEYEFLTGLTEYKSHELQKELNKFWVDIAARVTRVRKTGKKLGINTPEFHGDIDTCLLYTSPSPRDKRQSRMPSSA